MSTLSGKHGTSDTSAQSSLEPESEHEPMPEISPHSPQVSSRVLKGKALRPACIVLEGLEEAASAYPCLHILLLVHISDNRHWYARTGRLTYF